MQDVYDFGQASNAGNVMLHPEQAVPLGAPITGSAGCV